MSELSAKDQTLLTNTLHETGVFVTCGLETPNIMVTHWGALGTFWGRDVFILPIRSCKYSYQIVTKSKSFALNVPTRATCAPKYRCATR